MTAQVKYGEILLSVHNLRVDFHDPSGRVAVEDLGFDVREHEVLAIVGESGSGKSVTVMALMGLLPYYATVSGSLTVGGAQSVSLSDFDALRDLRGNSLAMVFQDPYASLDPVSTIGSQLEEAVRIAAKRSGEALQRSDAKATVRGLLEQVRLADVERISRSYPHELSGGQLQRVMIAIALAGNPSLLLADEPTTALDATVQQEVLDLLRDIADARDIGIVIITHDMGVVADVADRVLVMHNGHFVEQGEVRELFAHPHQAYTRDLLAAVPSVPSSDQEGTRAVAEYDVPAILDVDNVHVSYRDRSGRQKEVVHGVSFSIHPREILALVGQSGSGKSTIARSILGLAEITSGSVHFQGEDLRTVRRRRRRELQSGIGIVFQSPSGSLNPRLTIADIIAEPLRFVKRLGKAESRRRAAELLERVHLSRELLDRYPSELSGGQRQRVAIARAIALDPSLLIADEPTSALDVSVQAEILGLFKEIQQDIGFACLFISHDLPLVANFSHTAVVLHDGEVVESGATSDIFAHPEDDYTRNLIISAPVSDPIVQRQRRQARLAVAS